MHMVLSKKNVVSVQGKISTFVFITVLTENRMYTLKFANLYIKDFNYCQKKTFIYLKGSQQNVVSKVLDCDNVV